MFNMLSAMSVDEGPVPPRDRSRDLPPISLLFTHVALHSNLSTQNDRTADIQPHSAPQFLSIVKQQSLTLIGSPMSSASAIVNEAFFNFFRRQAHHIGESADQGTTQGAPSSIRAMKENPVRSLALKSRA